LRPRLEKTDLETRLETEIKSRDSITANYLRKHTNCTISLQERDLPTPLALRYAEKQQFY